MNTANTGAKITPAINPPIWAPNATPPSEPEMELLINCKTNQKINTTKAGENLDLQKETQWYCNSNWTFGKIPCMRP